VQNLGKIGANQGARAGLQATIVEISATAALMAAAAVGLRGRDARRASRDALKREREQRWSAVCVSAVKRRDADKQRLMQQLEERTRAVLALVQQDEQPSE